MKQYIVDAFTDKVFSGNPAAVCVMEQWLDDELLMKITMENNLSETAFAVWEGEAYHLRWFTPGGEIDLCGHATLATAYVILRFYHPHWGSVPFDTLSGRLTVTKRGELYEMDFPAYALRPVPVTDEMERAIGIRPLEAWMGRDLLCVLPEAETIPALQPDLKKEQDEGDFTSLLVEQEEIKTLPFGEIWAEYCRVCGVPCDGEWLAKVKQYEKDVLLARV